MQKLKASQLTTAIAVYKPTEPDQISLEEGDFVEIFNKSEDQEWWYGQKVRGKKTGWFPSTYVKPIDGKVGGAVAGFLGALGEKKQNVNRQSIPQKITNKLHGSENQEFISKLELVLQKNPETKRSFPHSHNAAKDDSGEEKPNVLNPLNKNKHLVVAIAAYLATSPNQLNLSIGDVIDVGQETDSGWSNGSLLNCSSQKHGWFPSSYVKTLGTEYDLTELTNTFEHKYRNNKTYSEMNYQDKGNLSDQSFESDDSDYESSTLQSSNAVQEAFLGPQTWAPKMPIAIMSLESIDAIQLYTQNSSFPMYLNLTMATEWRHAPAIMTTKTPAPMKPASAFSSTTSVYSAEWIVNFRLNIFSACESLIIQCWGELDQNESQNCLAETRMPIFDLIKQSRHLKKFTKGLPLRILNQEVLVPPGPKIKPCFLVKFDIIDLKV